MIHDNILYPKICIKIETFESVQLLKIKKKVMFEFLCAK